MDGEISGRGEEERELSVDEDGSNWDDMNRGGNNIESRIPMKSLADGPKGGG